MTKKRGFLVAAIAAMVVALSPVPASAERPAPCPRGFNVGGHQGVPGENPDRNANSLVCEKTVGQDDRTVRIDDNPG